MPGVPGQHRLRKQPGRMAIRTVEAQLNTMKNQVITLDNFGDTRFRVQRAVNLFESGYNCAQSVFAAYADLFGMDTQTALRLACPMGAGVGRMREVCGTVSAMALLSGLKSGNTDPADSEAKAASYEIVRKMSDAFREESGSILCRELLGMTGREDSAVPAERTKEYYASRPCTGLVARAAGIVEEMLLTGDI